MSKPLESVLVKAPYRKQQYSEEELTQFLKCADPDTGPAYFMDNFFYIQHPTQGKMLYHPYDYQKRLIETYHTNRFSISMMPRQTGKSTSAAGYILWYAQFVPDSTILIAAHKYSGAQEIMQRIRFAYELCPNHIRAGVTSYNKGSIDFENGSRIVSATTTETTGRGMSISLLYADEFAFVRPTIATEFWTSISPTLATGGKAIITSTPNSDEDQFALIWKLANKCVDEYGNPTERGINGFRAYRSYWQEHPDRDEAWGDSMRAQLGEDRFRREIGCLHGDSVLQLRTPDGKIIQTSIADLKSLLNKDSCVDEFLKNNKGYQILTDSGWEAFDGLVCRDQKPTLTLQLEQSFVVITPDHGVFLINGQKVEAKTLKPGQLVKTYQGSQKTVSISLNSGQSFVYDIVNAGSNKRFFANNILCANCEFIINDETLIAPTKLIDLQGRNPLYKTGNVRWYEPIKPDSIYVVALDPSLGTGGDPAAIQVFEANSTRQVAEWTHNRTPIPEQIRIMADICRHINDTVKNPQSVYFSVENNTIGEAALISIAEYGEENIQGYFLSDTSSVSARRFRRGYNTTHKTKIVACAKLKQLIETGRMTVASTALVSELKTFVASGMSYAAKVGETDDLVMATILAVRMLQTLQTYYQELDTQMRDHGDTIIEPMPFVSMMY